MSTQVILITGGNLGPVAETLNEARRRLIDRIGPETIHSSLYASRPWGFASDHPFLNQILVLETVLSPEEVLDAAQQIEKELGRTREDTESEMYQDRTLDVDILFYGDLVICTPRLEIPHPRIAERRFVLSPLVEVLPEWVHPRTGETMQRLLEKLDSVAGITD